MAHVQITVVSRRRLLAGGAALLAGRFLPACDRLLLPPDAEWTSIDPITSNEAFYVTSCCGTPTVDGATWQLSFTDGASIASIDMAFLETLPARDKEHTLQCIGSGPRNLAIGNAIWTGLPLVEVLEAAGLTFREALQLVLTAADGYSTAIPYADLPELWLVWRMNGEPLPPEHGYPARLLVPGRYGTKNVKWLVDIALVDQAYTGFWEDYGWSDDASYLANGLIARPWDGAGLDEGPVLVLGTAFAGRDPIARVELSEDGGQTWSEATITYQNGPDVWTLWEWDWEPPGPGRYVLKVRVTTESGATSAASSEATNALAGYDGSMEIEVRVR